MGFEIFLALQSSEVKRDIFELVDRSKWCLQDYFFTTVSCVIRLMGKMREEKGSSLQH